MSVKTVIITVEGGVIQDVDLPEDVVVIVRDYDCEGFDEDLLIKDEDGNECIESVWEHRPTS